MAAAEQTAVLYRDNESVIPLVDLLEYEQIPYRIKNAELGFLPIESCRMSEIS